MIEQRKSRIAQEVLALNEQTHATLQAAENATDGSTQILQAAANTVAAVAKRKAKILSQSPVLELPANASDTELRQARRHRAVRRGESLYLPSWRDMAVGFPNVLLRSALFAASNPGKALFEEKIFTQGDATLKMTGPQLSHYDRQVFAACLRYYRDDLTLHAANTNLGWVKVSFWRFAQDLNISYGLNGHIAIRESLIRLNAAHLRIRVNRKDIPLPHLIEVAFDDGYEGRNSTSNEVKGSDIVAFRVLDAMAELFGPEDWSTVSDSAIFESSSLQSWLKSFYSTHGKKYSLKISSLFEFSGSVGELREFRRRLKVALNILQGQDIDAQVRVERYEMDKEHVTVHLVRWKQESE